jgi:hypothetical protein
MSGELHGLAALSLGKDPPGLYCIERWAVQIAGVDDLEKRKLLLKPRIQKQFVGRLVRILAAILTD